MKKLRFYKLLILSAYVAVSTFSLLTFTVRVGAADAPLYPIEQSQIYNVFGYLRACSSEIYAVAWHTDTRSQQDLANGNVFSRPGFNSGPFGDSTNTQAGFLLGQGGVATNDDGYIECRGNPAPVAAALQLIGIDPIDFFVSAGTHVPGVSGYDLVRGIDDGARTALMQAEFQKRFPTIDFSKIMTPAMQYYSLIASFYAKCDRGIAQSGGTPIPIVQDDGTVNEQNYFVRDSGDKHAVGYGVPNADETNDSSDKMKCSTIVAQIIATAPAAAAETAALIASGANPAGSTVNASGPVTPSCESQGDEFSWLLCPALRGLDGLISYLDNQVNSLLYTPEAYYRSPQLEAAWARIRNLAYILLIPILLTMVIGTALGFNFLDAYTVKRALPRLLIATIFIVLSLPLLQILNDVVNGVGLGMNGLITSVTDGSGELTLSGLFNPTPGQGFAFTAGLLVGGLTAPIWFGAAMLLAITVLITIFTVFILLALRQMLIIAFLIFAPLAILAWIFPGNDKLWKLWWGSLWKMLLLYPLIMSLLAVGRVFADIVNASEVTGLIAIILKLVAYIGPFFFIPSAFKYAGGVLGNIGGMVNDRNRGAFDRLRKGRQQSLQKGFQNARSGNAKIMGQQVGRRYSKLLQGATNVDKAGINPLTMRSKMRTGLSDQSEQAVDEYSKSNEFRPISGDDAKLWAARFENEEDIANELATRDAGRFAGAGNARARADAVQQIRRAQKTTNRDTFQRARIKAQATTGTGYQNAQGEFDSTLMLDDINRTYGSDRNGAAGAIAQMRGALTQSGQVAGQAGFSEWAGAAERMYNAQTDTNLTAQQRLDVRQQAHESIMDSAIDSSNPGSAIYGKPSSARAMGAAHARRIQNIATSLSTGNATIDTGQRDAAGNAVMRVATQDDLDAATAASAGLLDAMGQASPQNASAFANELMGVTIQGSGQFTGGQAMQPGVNGPWAPGTQGPMVPQKQKDLTVREMIADRMQNEEYKNRRRDYGASATEQAAAAQNARNQPGAAGGPPTGLPGQP